MKKILLFFLLFLSCENVDNMLEDFNQEEFLSKQNYIKNLKGCSFDYSVGGWMPNIIVASVKQGKTEVLKIEGDEKEHFDAEEIENWEYMINKYSQFIFSSLDEIYSFILSEMNEYEESDGYSVEIKWNKEHDYVFDSIWVTNNKKKGKIGGDTPLVIRISNFVCEQLTY